MVKEVVHDPIFLAGKSEVATKEDLQVARDLLDTLIANKDGCVGMAANMIGVRKRIIPRRRIIHMYQVQQTPCRVMVKAILNI